MLKQFLWCWYFSADFLKIFIFYRNQILLCKCFDRKSLAISYNSVNSFGFFKRSKFRENQHPKSVSRGNRCTFLLELLCLDLPRLCPSAPSNFCCSHRWLSTITSLGASLLGACCILQQGQWPGGAQGNERRGRMPSEEHHFRSMPCQKLACTSRLPVPRQLSRAVLFIASRLSLLFPASIYWYTRDKHRNRRSSEAAADPGPFEMFPTGSFSYLYSLTSVLPKAN